MEICEVAGVELDPWQELVLRCSLGERADGKWSALEVGLEVSRQNGKGNVILARQLVGLFLLDEELQVHSAHEFDTCLEAFRRLRVVIEDSPDLMRDVVSIRDSNGREGIELTGRRRIRFRARTKGGGRGLSGDTLYLDEAMYIKEATHASLFPVMSARSNAQIWYVGSAVNQDDHDDGAVFAKIRQRGLWDNDPRLAWFSWGHAPDSKDGKELRPEDAHALLDDRALWAKANPALGIRIDEEFIAAERRSLSARSFAVERLGIGDWPDPDENAAAIFTKDVWSALLDRAITIDGPPVLAVDVAPDRSSASIGAAGRHGGLVPVELLEKRRGATWVPGLLAKLVDRQGSTTIVVDGRGPAASLIKDIEEKVGFEVTVMSTAEYAQACGQFFDAVSPNENEETDEDEDLEPTVRHGGQEELDAAVYGAATRPLGEAWAWSRNKSDVDITPLVACTLAHWGVVSQGEEESVWERRAKEGADSAEDGEEVALL